MKNLGKISQQFHAQSIKILEQLLVCILKFLAWDIKSFRNPTHKKETSFKKKFKFHHTGVV